LFIDTLKGFIIIFFALIIGAILGFSASIGKYLLSFMGNPGKWILTESIIWALFAALLLPFGYLAGVRILDRVTKSLKVKAWRVCVSSLAIIAVCFSVTAIVYAVIL
jgi:hypothetical protein